MFIYMRRFYKNNGSLPQMPHSRPWKSEVRGVKGSSAGILDYKREACRKM